MSFSCKIILAEHEKLDGMRRVYIQAIMDRRPARVPLEFYIDEKFFDKRLCRVKSTHPNSETYNTELQIAIAKANNLASKFRIQNKQLTPALFRAEYINPSDEMDLIKFIRKELELRTPELQENTLKQHNTVLNKLERFSKRIAFGDLSSELMHRFKNQMIKGGMMPSSVDKNLKIVKNYLSIARKNGIEFQDPFRSIRMKSYRSNRTALTELEIGKLDSYYQNINCPPAHKKLLRYFLFSCYTGLRISDITTITWNNIHDDMLIFTPVKTKDLNKSVAVPVMIEKKYLPPFTAGGKPIFDTFSDPVSNRYLKAIASKVGIKKKVTYHTSRHTFGTLMAEGGHLPETQKMMGHGNIRTTMEYVHTSQKSLIQAKRERFKIRRRKAPAIEPEPVKSE